MAGSSREATEASTAPPAAVAARATPGRYSKSNPTARGLRPHSFSRSDGLEPHAGLIQAADGNLYGTTAFGGTGSCSFGCGTIFKLDTNGNTFTTLHNFSGSDGYYVLAGLTQAADGYLYGTTASGGAGGYGTVFRIDTNGAAFTTLHSFANSEQPNTALIQGMDGNLYGTTQLGFPNDQFGTVSRSPPTVPRSPRCMKLRLE